MAFNVEHLDNVTSGAANAPRLWTYTTADLFSTVDEDGYFDDAKEDFKKYDLLYIVSTGDSDVQQRTISSETHASTVTTAGYVYDGAIETADIDALAVTDAKIALNIPRTVTVSMTGAQVNGMYAAPYLIVAAPGANLMHVVRDVVLEVDYGAAQFASGGALALQYHSTANGAGTLASVALAAATLNGYAADSTVGLAGASATSASTATVNRGLYMSNLTGAFTTGDSVVRVHVTYSTVATTV